MKSKRKRGCISYLSGLLLTVFAASTVYTPSALGSIILVSELSSNSSDEVGSITGDGLTIVFESRRNGIDDRIYSAIRATLNSPFSTPSDADYLNLRVDLNNDAGSPVISADGLTLFFGHSVGNGPSEIYVSTRATTSSPFGQGSVVAELEEFGQTRPSWLSPDGLRLYFHEMIDNQWDLLMAERPTLSSPFGTPSASLFANIDTTSFSELEATLTPNELQVYFTSNRPGGLGSFDIWTAVRPDTLSPFGTPIDLTTVNSPAFDRNPLVFGNTLFFTSRRNDPGGDFNSEDIFRTEINTVPEPSSIAMMGGLLAAVGIGMRWRRHNRQQGRVSYLGVRH